MKASLLTGIRRLEIADVPKPSLGSETDVLVKIGAVGICGSDVHYYASGGIGSMRVEYPFTVGHEAAGTVVEVGSEVIRVRAGDRVALEPAISCGQCDQCCAGRPHTCRQLIFRSCPGEASGFLCEYVVLPERNCYPVADTTRLEQAAISEPLSIGVHAVRQSVPMKGARIAVLGTGPIGLSVLLAARAAGAEKICATDKIAARREASRTAGAFWAGDPDREDVVAGIVGREPQQLDAVFECCGEQDALDQGLELLKPGGKLMIVGIPEERRISFDVDAFRRKEITVYYVRRQNDCVQRALDLIEGGGADVDFLISHRFALEEVGEAFEMLTEYRDGVIKAMVRPW